MTRMRHWLGVVSAVITSFQVNWIYAGAATIPVTRAVISTGNTNGRGIVLSVGLSAKTCNF